MSRGEMDERSIASRKRALRRELKRRRRALSTEERRVFSERAARALLESEIWRTARRVALFHSMDEEIETRLLLEAAWKEGKQVALPLAPPLGAALELRLVTSDTTLARSRYGALEPPADAPLVAPSALDLLIVPGLGFDRRGARLGYGGGYYDRTLASAPCAILFAFACQEVDEIPEEAHDRRVDGVVTERGWVWFRS